MTDTSTDPHIATALIVALADERDALLAERDALLAERDALLAERDALAAKAREADRLWWQAGIPSWGKNND